MFAWYLILWYIIPMSELVSRELFERFQDSSWPRQFSAMAQKASGEGVAVDELQSFGTWETGLITAPKKDEEMLKDMGIIEQRLAHKGFVTPSMAQDGFRGDPNTYSPRFSDFGKQVIMACENLFTTEELTTANEAAESRLELLIAEAKAKFAITE